MMPAEPTLLVLAGLPGTGKSTVAQRVARQTTACSLRVDAAETALARLGRDVREDGYAVVFELAVSNLLIGHDVIVDAVNATAETRQVWHEAAARGGGRLRFAEIVLADAVEHRRRVELRRADIPGHRLPSWEDVETTHWTAWDEARDGPRIVVDGADADQASQTLLSLLSGTS